MSKRALREAAMCEMNLQKWDDAIEKLQKLIRMLANQEEAKSELATIWSFVGEIYKKRLNLQSAVRAFKVVLELAPNSVSARLQVFFKGTL